MMQKAHELAEARARADKLKTEQLQLMEIEHQVIHGFPSVVTQLREKQRELQMVMATQIQPLTSVPIDLQEAGKRWAESAVKSEEYFTARQAYEEVTRELEFIENQIMGVEPWKKSDGLPKLTSDMDSYPHTKIDQQKVKDFMTVTGRRPTVEEMRKWLTKK